MREGLSVRVRKIVDLYESDEGKSADMKVV